MSKLIAVAALSARMLAESARDGGYRSVALDLFGDADTRLAAEAWWPIGTAARFAIDGDALQAALRCLRRRGVAGWIAGSGFEGRPELLAAGARLLPLVGNAPAVVASVRNPACFFDRLAALGIPHPETSLAPPSTAAGWLRKNAGSSGGWEVRPAGWGARNGTQTAAGCGTYHQRIAPGQPMSALFLADGRRSRLLGVNLQLVRRLGARPYVFHGCIGPVPVPAGLRRELEGVLDALTASFGLRGLNGLDFLLAEDRLAVLELNPRPAASMALYRDALPGGLVRAHWAASLDGRLPAGQEEAPAVRGFEVVFARGHCRIGAAAADSLARQGGCHDLPALGTCLAWGEPVCTVSAEGISVAEVQAQLLRRRRQIPFLLEQTNESSGNSNGNTSPVRETECQ